MENRIVLNSKHFEITLKRLASQLKENHKTFENTVLIGLQPRGIHVLERLKSILEEDLIKKVRKYGSINGIWNFGAIMVKIYKNLGISVEKNDFNCMKLLRCVKRFKNSFKII